jgi:hypothetical protein
VLTSSVPVTGGDEGHKVCLFRQQILRSTISAVVALAPMLMIELESSLPKLGPMHWLVSVEYADFLSIVVEDRIAGK